MKQRALAIAGCIAAVMPTVCIADVLPENLLGLNLGEISSSSFLNQPFKGVIPLLFTNYESTQNLRVTLAPDSIFNEVGAEKHPILNSLNFQITQQGNKPVILISSDTPINMPFLNFILEIQEHDQIVYQDYTVLLDPQSKQAESPTVAKYISTDKFEVVEQSKITLSNISPEVSNEEVTLSSEDLLRKNGKLLLASLSANVYTSGTQNLKYKVKSGDSLSKIAQDLSNNKTSIKTMSQLIYQKNSKAFIRGDVNRLRRGVVINLPTDTEINGFEVAQKSKNIPKLAKLNEQESLVNKEIIKADLKVVSPKIATSSAATPNIYKVVKGDNLSKITKKFATKDISFTKMMGTIYSSNPTAFVNNSKNRLKAGVELIIPNIAEIGSLAQEKVVKKEVLKNVAIEKVAIVKEQTKKDVTSIDKQTVEQEFQVSHEPEVELKSNQYKVQSGDTLSQITKKLGYKEVPFAKMLKLIFVTNTDAFVDGKMSKLTVGSILTLPPLSDIEIKPVESKLASKVEIKSTPAVEVAEEVKTNAKAIETAIIATNTQAAPNDLIKRIRELRKELQEAKKSLTNLKGNLNNKETLLEQKNIQLESLNSLLTKIDPDILAATAVKTKVIKAPLPQEAYKPRSKAEIAKFKREYLNKQGKTKEQLAKIEELKNRFIKSNNSIGDIGSGSLFKNYESSSKLTNTHYIYLTLALLLGSLLIRYRREIYSLTYAKVNLDLEKYQPVPDKSKYDLTEKNINFSDPKMDEDPSNYELRASETEQEKIHIDPNLVEANTPIFESYDETRQIEKCENLVTELFNDLDDKDSITKEKEWSEIERVCEKYIQRNTVVELSAKATGSEDSVDNATDFNHMMSGLLESLDKVDKSVKKNKLYDEDFPEIVSKTILKARELNNTTSNRL